MGEIYFAAVKYISSSTVDKSLKSNEIFVVDDGRHKYWPFDPKHLEDFDNSTTRYGAIKSSKQGKIMKYLKIVKLSNTYDDLGRGRVKIPRRWSTGLGSEPLKAFKFVEEGESAKKASQKPKSHLKMKDVDKDKSHRSRSKSVSTGPTSKAVNNVNKEDDRSPKTPSDESVSTNASAPLKKHGFEVQSSHLKVKGHNTAEFGTDSSPVKNDALKVYHKKYEVNGSLVKKIDNAYDKANSFKIPGPQLSKESHSSSFSTNCIDITSIMEGRSSITLNNTLNNTLNKSKSHEGDGLQISEQMPSIESGKENPCSECTQRDSLLDTAKKDLKKTKGQLQAALQKVKELEEANKSLEEANKSLEEAKKALEETNKLLKDANTDNELFSKAEVMQLLKSNLKGPSSFDEESFLRDEKFLVEADSDEIEVPDGMVYCGNGVVVKKLDLFECSKGTSFGRRVARVLDVLYPGATHQHFLSGVANRAPPTLTIAKITTDEVKAIKKILKSLPGWEAVPKVDITTANICQSIKNYTSQCLTNFLGKTNKGEPLKSRRTTSRQGKQGSTKRSRRHSSSSSEERQCVQKNRDKKKEDDTRSGSSSSGEEMMITSPEKKSKRSSVANGQNDKNSSDGERSSTSDK